MFRRYEMDVPQDYDVYIGSNMEFKGSIKIDGTVRVDGRIDGNLNVNGDVYIGNAGVVTGDIISNNAVIFGTVHGNISSEGILNVMSSAKVRGNIRGFRISTQRGSFFQGECDIGGIRCTA
jgi:cytoskeletal protein CcmA (bactofilin family)